MKSYISYQIIERFQNISWNVDPASALALQNNIIIT